MSSVPFPRHRLSTILVVAVVTPAIVVALASFRVLTGDPRLVPPPLVASLIANGWVFLAHAGFGALALLVGGFQLLPALRNRRPDLHRAVGRFYAVSCLAGACAGFAISWSAPGGPVATAGFALLAVVWFATTALGWRAARTGDHERHARWMIRSYALTFSAVTLRIQLGLSMAVGSPYETASQVLAFSCWVPNLALAWWLTRRSPRPVSAA